LNATLGTHQKLHASASERAFLAVLHLASLLKKTTHPSLLEIVMTRIHRLIPIALFCLPFLGGAEEDGGCLIRLVVDDGDDEITCPLADGSDLAVGAPRAEDDSCRAKCDCTVADDGTVTLVCEEDENNDCAQVCVVDDRRLNVGETFSDGCNTCTCLEDGNVACTERACTDGCFYNGTEYRVGDSFPADDGCNTCFCGEDGNVGCSEMACPVDLCGEALCDSIPPECDEGTIPAVQFGCWTGECIDEEICRAPADLCGPAFCDMAPPVCEDSQIPAVQNGCYTGECIAAERCEACVTEDGQTIARGETAPFANDPHCSWTCSADGQLFAICE